ncbi:MAG: DUF1641 domain-containing protein [Desulfobulbaceae bacterium]|nr:DUF1641 domain-containing protein [Desulfobulbaceae bacterium]
MDEALILQKLDSLSEEVRSLRSGVLEELKKDLLPVIQQATPRVMEFFSELEGSYSNEELAAMVKNLLLNIKNLNAMLDTLKSAMELKDDMGAVTKLALPKAVEFMSELDGQFSSEDMKALLKSTLGNLKHLNNAMGMLKSGMELKDDMGAVVQQALPKIVGFFAELDGQVTADDLNAVLKSTLSNLKHLDTAMGMLKAGMEFKEDMGPVVQQALPKIVEFFGDIHGHVESDDVINLLKKTMASINYFSDGLDIWISTMELKKDLAPVVRQAFPRAQAFFSELENNGAVRLSLAIMGALNKVKYTDAQIDRIVNLIESIDLSKPNPVTPFGAFKQLRDPKVQEALGASFTILHAVGSVLEISRSK